MIDRPVNVGSEASVETVRPVSGARSGAVSDDNLVQDAAACAAGANRNRVATPAAIIAFE